MVAAKEAEESTPIGAGEFESFAAQERPRLVAFAWSLTGRFAEAEELAQEALAAAWRHWDRIGRYDAPRSWARRVLLNAASNRRRKATREGRAFERLTSRHGDDQLDLPDPDLALWRAVGALPERQAQVVVLHYIDDRSVGEIAEVLDCSTGTVKTHLHRARLALADALEDDHPEEDR